VEIDQADHWLVKDNKQKSTADYNAYKNAPSVPKYSVKFFNVPVILTLQYNFSLSNTSLSLFLYYLFSMRPIFLYVLNFGAWS
jgi:hypothetical protein